MYYTLKDKAPIPCSDTLTWANDIERVVAQNYRNKTRVSTVFLGIDHSFTGGKPVLFETMIFGGEYDGEQWRYTTWDDAEAGHRRAMSLTGEFETLLTKLEA